MRIWTRKSASIQPRTSLRKSDVSWPRARFRPRQLRPEQRPATTQHSFGGSFSAGSKPIFASKAAFFSIFQNLQENHLLASKFWKFLPKNWKILQKFCKNFDIFWQILQNFAKFSEIRKNFAKFCRIFCRILQKCVDFEKC